MIRIENLRKRFDDGRWITDGVNLTIPDGKMTVIVGLSGKVNQYS